MLNQSIFFEIPVFSAEDAVRAAQLGADRLELCASYSEGGLTPGAGLLKVVKQRVKIPVFVMIRPVGGHFNYSELDLKVMAEELEELKSNGADGFVFGVLRADNSVNIKACARLVNLAGELPCTFHRAFDQTPDAFNALKEINELGFRRVLTSGQQPEVEKGLPLIKKLIDWADSDIIIMPGGGMKPEFIKILNQNGRLREFHASCRIRDKEEDKPSGNRSMIDAEIVARFKKEIS